MEDHLRNQIEKEIHENGVVLFMKGNKKFPMCGFSALVCQILTELDVTFHDINVLENPELRDAIKEYSDWPTIPQLYINGEFIGGSDITKQLYETGELAKFFKKNA